MFQRRERLKESENIERTDHAPGRRSVDEREEMVVNQTTKREKGSPKRGMAQIIDKKKPPHRRIGEAEGKWIRGNESAGAKCEFRGGRARF